MILSDQAIRWAMDHDLLIVQPLLEPIQSTSIDLRLGGILLDENGDIVWDLQGSGPYQMTPGDFFLGSTLEWVQLPVQHPHKALAGILVGKSSRAREGLQVEAAGYVDPGWMGNLTLELYNMARNRIQTLVYGMVICQIRFEWVDGPLKRLYGDPDLGSHYQGAAGPQGSRLEQ
jgi:dCTP deaminase